MYLGQFVSPFLSAPAREWFGIRLAFQLGAVALIGLGIVFVVYSSMAGMAAGESSSVELAVEEGHASDADDA